MGRGQDVEPGNRDRLAREIEGQDRRGMVDVGRRAIGLPEHDVRVGSRVDGVPDQCRVRSVGVDELELEVRSGPDIGWVRGCLEDAGDASRTTRRLRDRARRTRATGSGPSRRTSPSPLMPGWSTGLAGRDVARLGRHRRPTLLARWARRGLRGWAGRLARRGLVTTRWRQRQGRTDHFGRHAARREDPGRPDMGAAAQRRAKGVDDRGGPPLAFVAVWPADRVDDVVGGRWALVVVAVEVDGMAAGEPSLQLELLGDLRVIALDHGAVPGREQVVELRGLEQPLLDRDAIAAPQGRCEVVEPGAAHLVVLERPEDRTGRHDAEPEPREHRARSERAVRPLERAAVELRHRGDPREPGRIEPAGRRRIEQRAGREAHVAGRQPGHDDRRRLRTAGRDEIERGKGGRRCAGCRAGRRIGGRVGPDEGRTLAGRRDRRLGRDRSAAGVRHGATEHEGGQEDADLGTEGEQCGHGQSVEPATEVHVEEPSGGCSSVATFPLPSRAVKPEGVTA